MTPTTIIPVSSRLLLVWLALGDRNSWQDQDPEDFPGTALMTTIPEHLEPVGDLRLVALREAQQLSAWMDALKALEGLERAQLDALLEPLFAQDEDGWWRGRSGDPGRNRRGALHANDLERLRRLLAERWEEASRLK